MLDFFDSCLGRMVLTLAAMACLGLGVGLGLRGVLVAIGVLAVVFILVYKVMKRRGRIGDGDDAWDNEETLIYVFLGLCVLAFILVWFGSCIGEPRERDRKGEYIEWRVRHM